LSFSPQFASCSFLPPQEAPIFLWSSSPCLATASRVPPRPKMQTTIRRNAFFFSPNLFSPFFSPTRLFPYLNHHSLLGMRSFLFLPGRERFSVYYTPPGTRKIFLEEDSLLSYNGLDSSFFPRSGPPPFQRKVIFAGGEDSGTIRKSPPPENFFPLQGSPCLLVILHDDF